MKVLEKFRVTLALLVILLMLQLGPSSVDRDAPDRGGPLDGIPEGGGDPVPPVDLLDNMDGWFTENRGQFGPGPIRYYSQGEPLSVGFATGRVVYYHLSEGSDRTSVYQMVFEGGEGVPPEGVDPLDHSSSFLLGNEPGSWVSGARNYGAVRYRDLWSGVDLLFYMRDGKLKYDLVVGRGRTRR